MVSGNSCFLDQNLWAEILFHCKKYIKNLKKHEKYEKNIVKLKKIKEEVGPVLLSKVR